MGKENGRFGKRLSVIQKELINSGLLQAFPNAKIIVNPDRKLAIHGDHNYGFTEIIFLELLSTIKQR